MRTMFLADADPSKCGALVKAYNVKYGHTYHQNGDIDDGKWRWADANANTEVSIWSGWPARDMPYSCDVFYFPLKYPPLKSPEETLIPAKPGDI